tara:strand:- start:86 stop:310 length:225 start_codon:yes stop_codon:yes gene_type:complete
MKDHHTYENGLKYKPDYKWPKQDSKENCPRCSESLELMENNKTYYGKPWWCAKCQWQFSQEDLDKVIQDSKEEE